MIILAVVVVDIAGIRHTTSAVRHRQFIASIVAMRCGTAFAAGTTARIAMRKKVADMRRKAIATVEAARVALTCSTGRTFVIVTETL